LENFESIPYGRQEITEEDIETVTKVLNSDFLTQGPVVPLFEEELCNYTGAKHSVVVNSCTSALHIACLALNLEPGDVLWTSPITFVASANCALYCGATVDFVDIEPDTALMSVKKLAEKLERSEKEGKLPKIVIPVHFAGQPCDMKEIHALSQKYDFKIIEDAAHAIGAKYQNEPVGNCKYSDITVFSFHPVKVITTGEGGAAMTNSYLLAEKMDLLRSHGITRDPVKMRNKPDGPWYYEQIELGFNYRMTDIQAALGINQLSRLEQYVLCRNEIVKWYDVQFNDIPISHLTQKFNRSSAHHLYVILLQEEFSFYHRSLFTKLRKEGVGVNLHYIPVYRQPNYRHMGYMDKKYPNSERYYRAAISLPIYPALTKIQQNTVVDSVLTQILSLTKQRASNLKK
jgi:UDP-4-amino-4,6-dideoxy-N-acetyl-beta-L-altrosamine transaminase